MNVKSLMGQRFGKLLVIGEAGPRRLCRCDCGREKLIRGDGLKSGRSTTCGECNRKLPHVKSVLGNRYGKLTVIEEHQVGRNRRVKVRCDCGNVVTRVLANLKRGQTKSCGCTKTYDHKHGMIYYLLDPRDNSVRYVGQTVQEPSVRLNCHIGKGRTTGRIRFCKEKREWIDSLFPMRPIIFVAERNVPVSRLSIREQQYIACLRSSGADLLNIHHASTGTR